ncbi:MAG: DsbA family protein [Patescibacteria group bacterium]|jgi:protein-disulfide isomerase
MSLDERIKYAEMKARHKRALRPWYKKFWGILLIIFLSFFAIIFIYSAIYVTSEVGKILKGEPTTILNTPDPTETFEKLLYGQGGYYLGSNDPKITIIEFTDFACPYCRQSAIEILPLLAEYQDTVKLVIRDYPLHDNSIELAVAMRCAGEQGRYWEGYEAIFLGQDLLEDKGEELKENLFYWGDIIGLDLDRFETCYDERRYLDLIRRDYEDGLALDILGTPTWFINGYPLTGYYPAGEFRVLFDNILEEIERHDALN